MAPSVKSEEPKVSKTYGKKPVASLAIKVKQSKEDLDSSGLGAAIEDCKRPDILKEISDKLKKVELQLSNALPAAIINGPNKSRKSDIRPRKSIAPSQLEYNALLHDCSQDEPMDFSEWLEATKWYEPYGNIIKLFSIVYSDYLVIEKIGESSFSEVFRMYRNPDQSDAIAVKIMPILRPGANVIQVNGRMPDPMPIPVPHLLHEIETLQALESLRAERRYSVPLGYTGFNRLVHCMLVVGPFPEGLVAIWDDWKHCKDTYNDRPDFYSLDSLHVIITMEYGGLALEDYPLESVDQIHAVLCQITSAIALAEDKYNFEHRDLHLGNVLVRSTNRADLKLGSYLTIPANGLICNIIDCSLARYLSSAESSKIPSFRDLSKEEWLFTGDVQISRQYEIYRQMRDLIKEDWEGYHPETNLLWIKFIGKELLEKHGRLAKKQKEKYDLLVDAMERLSSHGNCKLALQSILNLFIEKK